MQQSLIDDIINSINNLIYQAISSLENGLLNTPPEKLGFGRTNNTSTIPDTDADGNIEYPEATLEIENGLHQLETLFESSVDKSFDKFEIYVLRNIFTVPDELVNYMRLNHYEVCRIPHAGILNCERVSADHPFRICHFPVRTRMLLLRNRSICREENSEKRVNCSRLCNRNLSRTKR